MNGKRVSYLGMIGIQFGKTLKALHFDYELNYV